MGIENKGTAIRKPLGAATGLLKRTDQQQDDHATNDQLLNQYHSLFGPHISIGIVLLVMSSISWGCGARPAANLPETYSVTGKVFDVSNRPMSGGFVEFQSKSHQNVMAIGNIQSDGSFALSTYIDGTELTGAVEGKHEVTVHPTQEEHGSGEPIHIRQTYVVEAKSNEITLNLSRR